MLKIFCLILFCALVCNVGCGEEDSSTDSGQGPVDDDDSEDDDEGDDDATDDDATDDDDSDDDDDDNDTPEPVWGRLRVFTVQYRQLIEDCAEADDFHDRIDDLFATRIAPHLSQEAVNLVAFPEYTGLTCSCSGSRGRGARGMNNLLPAFVSLALSYGPAMLHTWNRFPGISLQRALFLSLTDALWRPFQEAFSAIAREYGIFILAGTVVADAAVSSDPEDIKWYGDPAHPEREWVYVPANGNVYNQSILFGPDGEIEMRWRKVHLVEGIEDTLMDLSTGTVEDLQAYALNGAALGVAVCLDSWYEDVRLQLKGQGVNLLIVPSANARMWADQAGYWEPEAWYGGAWEAVQGEPQFLFGMNPMMTGNFFEMPFDGQSTILDRNQDGAWTGYMGTEYREGFRGMAPWVMADPCLGAPGDECRGEIQEQAEALLPGGAEENAYVETVLWTDLFFD